MEYKVGDKFRVTLKDSIQTGKEYFVGEVRNSGVMASGVYGYYFYYNEIEPAYEEGELVNLNLNPGDVVQWTGNGVRGNWGYPFPESDITVSEKGSVVGVAADFLHRYTGIWRVISRAEVKPVKYTQNKTMLVKANYGQVSVSRTGRACLTPTDNPSEMREAAETLIAMADELEGKR